MERDKKTSLCGWETCSGPVKTRVEEILSSFRRILGDNLTGFYLHGSLAMGCFNPLTSDIDFLAVVNEKMTTPQKQEIIALFLEMDDSVNPPEMSIVTEASLKNIVFPPLYELHYSIAHRETYSSGNFAWEEQRVDTDLPAHYMAVQERGICLHGKPFREILPEVPQEMFLASVVQDLHWIKQEISRLPSFHTIVLNPCRAMAYAAETKYMSKQEGGEWALTHLPAKYTTLIEKALNAYSGTDTPDTPSLDALTEFVDYAVKEFIYLAAKTDAENLFFKGSY